MFLFWQHRHTTAGRALILVALLALFGGNLLEAGHDHEPHEVTADCLLYHASASGVCGGIHHVITPDYRAAVAAPTPLVAPTARIISVRPPPRGPPAHS